MMAKPAWACFLSAIVLTFICAGIYAFIERADVARATLSGVSTIVGVDTNTTGNDASHVGNIDRCIAITSSGTFYIDLFVKDVTDLNKWEGAFTFDESIVAVNSLTVEGYFLGNINYPMFDCYPGMCLVGDYDTTGAGHPGSGVAGSGVLGRLALTPVGVGATTKTSKLYFTSWPLGVSAITLEDSGNPPDPPAPIGDLNGDRFFDGLVFNAIVVVGTDATCPTDADLDGFTNVEESVDGSDLLNAASTPEMCDGVDNDQDGLTDEWYDRDPANGIPDCTDPASDSDDDGNEDSCGAGTCNDGIDNGPLCNGAGADGADGNDPNCVPSMNPTDTDDDNDGFTDAQETYLGTDSLADCRVNSYHSAWPLDINNDGSITTVGDVLSFRGLIGAADGDGKFRKRLDFNTDHSLTTVGDVLKFRGRIGTGCS
jgi:hypothetical protein